LQEKDSTKLVCNLLSPRGTTSDVNKVSTTISHMISSGTTSESFAAARKDIMVAIQ
jgi:hypothetical protein